MAASNQATGQCFTVCLPEAGVQKKYSMLKFAASHKVDFTAGAANKEMVKLERENNFKEFKSAYDIDVMPKFGAGSEFGREAREEARKKKFGGKIRKYNAQDQPWLLKLGNGKQSRRFKGTRSGGVSENASYYVFMPLSESKFVAQPVEDWYDFNPLAKYKSLNAEEAEEEFSKRGKTLNHFAIMMMKKRLNGADDGVDPDEGTVGGKKKSKKSKASLVLSEFDEVGEDDDDGNDDDDSDDETKDDEDEGKSKKKQKAKKPKKQKKDTDDEAMEESDDLDEGQEVDYMSGSSGDDEGMYDEKKRDEESETYKDSGVVEEEGLRKLNDSEDEDEDDEEKKDEDNDDDEEGKSKDDKNKDSDSDTSSDSEIDSDPEKSSNFLLMLGDKKPSVTERKNPQDNIEADVPTGSRPSTPASDATSNSKKRKGEAQSSPASSKKPKVETPTTVTTVPSTATTTSPISNTHHHVGDGSMEDAVRRYLLRKPMTTKDLLQKVTSKYAAMSKDHVMHSVGQILKRLNPEKTKVNNKLYLFFKKDS